MPARGVRIARGLPDRVTAEILNGAATSYAYDVTNQLTTVTTLSGSTSYSYDLNGNRTMPGYQTGGANQLTNDGTWAYSYDLEGNLIKKSKGLNAETWTYGYDNLNHTVWARDAATDGGGATSLSSYVYDPLGNRIEKDVWPTGGPTTVTRFAYDRTDVWADLTNASLLQARYIHGNAVDQILARLSSLGSAGWYLPDRLGSVRNLVDASGNVQDTVSYDAFGAGTGESNVSFGDRYKYTGREFDSETGQQESRARYYLPTVGRWTTTDPLGLSVDLNPYRYVQNNPTNGVDPTGLVVIQDFGPTGLIHPVAEKLFRVLALREAGLDAYRDAGEVLRGSWGCNLYAEYYLKNDPHGQYANDAQQLNQIALLLIKDSQETDKRWEDLDKGELKRAIRAAKDNWVAADKIYRGVSQDIAALERDVDRLKTRLEELKNKTNDFAKKAKLDPEKVRNLYNK